MKAQPQVDNATTVVSNLILRPVWNVAKRIHQNNPQLIDITDRISYITFKNEMMNKIFHTTLLQQVNGYKNRKSKKKINLTNTYFDNTLSRQYNPLIKSATEQLLLLKSQQTYLSQDDANHIYSLIYNTLATQPVQAQNQNQ
jgi:hypothetical protein